MSGRECRKLFVSSKNEIGNRKHLLLKTDQNGWNVMHFAAKGGNLRIFQKLQSENLNVCSKTRDKMTVFHIAPQNGNYDLCKYILDNTEFEDILKARSVLGKTLVITPQNLAPLRYLSY